MHARDVHQLPRRAVRLGRIKDEFPREADRRTDQLGKFANADILSRADVHQRWVVGRQELAVGAVLHFQQKDDACCEVVGVQQLPFRRTGTPYAQARGPGPLRLYRLAHQRRQHMRALQIEVVLCAVQIAGHRSDVAGAVLPIVGPTHLHTGDLGQRVGAVGGLKRPRQEVLLLDGLRAHLGINAAGAKKHQPFDAGLAGGLDDIELDLEVVPQEIPGVGVVGEDAAYLGRRQHNGLRALRLKKRPNRRCVGQIQFGVRTRDQLAVTGRL